MKFDWRHYVTLLLAPTIGAFCLAFSQSGNALTAVALENDVKAAIVAFLIALGAMFVPSPAKAAAIVLAFATLAMACSAAQQSAAVPASAELAICVIPDVVGCALASPPTPWPACVAKVVVDCKTDEASVISIWATHKNAAMREADAGVSYP